MLFSPHRQDIIASFTEFLILLAQQQSIFHPALKAKRRGVHEGLLLHEGKHGLGGGPVKVKLHLSIFMKRDDLEWFLGEVGEHK